MMSENEPLYEDSKLIIDYLPNSPEDYQMIIGKKKYLFQRGILKELGTCKAERLEGILKQININLKLPNAYLQKCFSKAYIEEERRITKFINENSP